MKNKLFLAALAALTLSASVATAEGFRREITLPWLRADATVPNGAFATHSGTQPLNTEAGAIDTTGIFSLTDADILSLGGRGVDNVASQDSVLIGYIVVYTDSTADGASTCTAITASIDASGDGADWAAVGTTAAILASDDPVAALPLVLRPGLDHQLLLTTAPKLRIRFTTVTGILLAARCKLIYRAVPQPGSGW